MSKKKEQIDEKEAVAGTLSVTTRWHKLGDITECHIFKVEELYDFGGGARKSRIAYVLAFDFAEAEEIAEKFRRVEAGNLLDVTIIKLHGGIHLSHDCLRSLGFEKIKEEKKK